MVNVDKQQENSKRELPTWLQKHKWGKGVSGNPNGRPKEKTMKEFAREYLSNMTEEQRFDFMSSISPEMIWKMSEGNPHQTSDETVKVVLPKPILPDDLPTNNSNKES